MFRHVVFSVLFALRRVLFAAQVILVTPVILAAPVWEANRISLRSNITHHAAKRHFTYTPDFLTGNPEKNNGELAMYLIENAHEPIIDLAAFERVQEMRGKTKKKELTK